jgi:hypothetical protein
MTANRRMRNIGCACSVGVLLATSSFAVQPSRTESQKVDVQEPIVEHKLNANERFEQLTIARDDSYERQRLALFADADAVANLRERFDDPDPVTAFIARQLHLWGAENPPEFIELDGFLETGIYARRTERDQTAGGWQPSQELSVFLTLRGHRRISEHLLLRLLMKPRTNPVWMYGGALEFHSIHPVSEPEVWIRIALEEKNDAIFDHLANLSLRVTDKSRTLRALNYERARCQRLKQPFPPQLESLRKELTQAAGK